MKKIIKFTLLAIILLILAAIIPFGESYKIIYIDRATQKVDTEKVAGEFWLNWLYNNPVGKASLEALIKRKIVSEWYGSKMDNPESKEKIKDFVNNFKIDLSEAQKQNFVSFNDFFTRKLKPDARKIDSSKNVIISPADGKILAYSNINNQDFIVKNYRFNIYTFLNDSALANKFKDGSLFIIRLCPTDYHRFHFPFDGNIDTTFNINGSYYSVSPIALKKNIELLCMNKRHISLLKAYNGTNVIYSEVGATMVGSIIDTYKNKNFTKAEEKGYFKFGGSTIILIFPKNTIKIDTDLLKNTNNKMETSVKMGERVAVFY